MSDAAVRLRVGAAQRHLILGQVGQDYLPLRPSLGRRRQAAGMLVVGRLK